MRLARYLAHAGIASRRRAERLIAAGRVWVDGERVIDPARNVDETNEVTVDGRQVSPERREYYLVNKPVGVVSTAQEPGRRPKVTDLVRSDARLYPVGRLDVDTSGLIILTNDGELANRLMHPRFEVQKTYRATIEGTPGERDLETLRTGVELEDGLTSPAKVKLLRGGRRESVLEITIHQGRKRQVRRMFEAIGHAVLELERTRYGHLELRGLEEGAARALEPEEVEALRREGSGPKGR